jgi:hypothetical protein
MVSNQQVKRLWRLAQTSSLELAAAKAGMDPGTARKYLRARRLPSEMQQKHTWRTRPDPFANVWDEIQGFLKVEPGLQAKTIFEYLQEKQPGRFSEGQVRTLQRRIKSWRALEGPPREVFFAQDHYPDGLCQSDFTHCRELGITINGQPFPHLIYHFVLTYSNWETGTICYSETFESLSEGLQNALWELGGVPNEHRSDRMSAAVNNLIDTREFTRAYEGLLRHYGLTGQKIQAGEAHENGDIEQRHYRFKQAVDQALMMRGSRDFATVAAYDQFLRKLFTKMNASRRERFGRRTVAAPAIARTAPGFDAARTGEGNARQPDPRSPKHLLGAQSVNRRGRGSSHQIRHGGSLVWRSQSRGTAAAAWPKQASHRLPAYYRLARSKAGRLRTLSLSGGSLSHELVPLGI